MELAIFDLDGVIVSTDDYHYEAWQELAIRYSLSYDRQINEKLRGVSRAESLKIILDHNHSVIDQEAFEEMLVVKNNIYKENLYQLNEKHILPGVLELIKNLKLSGYKIAIGSSSRNALTILKQIGLSDRFDVIVDGNMIKNSKPDPEVFMKGADMLEVPYHACMVFEDAEAGIIAAKSCGMATIGIGAHELDADVHYKSLENVTLDNILKDIGVLNE